MTASAARGARPWRTSTFPAPDLAEIDRSLHAALADLATRRPREIAVLDGDREITFAELAGLAGGMAERLRAVDAAEGPVAVLLSAGVDAVAAWFACAAAGRPLLLLETTTPAERLTMLIELAGAAVLLVDEKTASLVRDTIAPRARVVPRGDTGELPLSGGLAPAAAALIFPTSGSTGDPKLIAYSAQTLFAKACASVGVMGIGAGETVLIAGSHGNYGFLHHAMVFLLAGSALCITDVRAGGLGALFDTLARRRVGHVRFTPSLFRVAAAHPAAADAMKGLRGVRFSGEPLLASDLELARSILSPECRIQNIYGSTESALFAWTDSGRALPPEGIAPIGQIYPLAQFTLLTDAGAPSLGEEEGELVIRSPYQALGDWTRDGLDSSRFTPDATDDGLRLYATGDIVRPLPDGALVMLGRKDRLVKINGNRVSLLEVEARLRALPGCDAAAVVALRDARGTRLAAFVVAAASTTPDELRRALAAQLPPAMIPSRIENVASLPLLPGAKIDYGALAARAVRPAEVAIARGRSAFDALESMWRGVLNVSETPPDSDFFGLGGDSLRLLELDLALENTFGRALDLGAFLERPTLAALAETMGILPPPRRTRGTRPWDGEVRAKRVRRADGDPRGVVLAMPSLYGGAFVERLIEAGALRGHDVWTFETAFEAGDMLSHRRWHTVARLIAASIRAGDTPAPDALFGFSIGGYIAWHVDRRLEGTSVRPGRLVCLDSPAVHRRPRYSTVETLGLLMRPPARLARMLHFQREPPSGVALPFSWRHGWRATDADITAVAVRSIEHTDLVAPAAAPLFVETIEAFLAGRLGPEADAALGPIDTDGGRLFEQLVAAAPDSRAIDAMAREISTTLGIRSLAALLHLTLAHGDLSLARDVTDRFGRSYPRWPLIAYAARRLTRVDLAAPPAANASFPLHRGDVLQLDSPRAVDEALRRRGCANPRPADRAAALRTVAASLARRIKDAL